MKLVTRYVLAHFRRVFLLSLAAFVGLYLLIDFFEKVDNFIQYQAPLPLYLLYFGNSVPGVVVQVIPVAMLLAVFLTIGGLSRTNELTALRSGGLSLARITLPLLALAFLVSLTVLAAGEYLVPLTTKKMNHLLRVEVKGRPEVVYKLDKIWFREGNAIINVRHFRPEQNALEGISVFHFDDEFRLRSRLDAPQAVSVDGLWQFEDLTAWRFDPPGGAIAGRTRAEQETVDLARTAEDFKVARPKTEEMSFRQLRAFVRKLKREGYDATRYRVDMYARLANPFASLIMAFLGIPFALQRGRNNSLAMGIGLSVAIGIAYHLVHAMLMAFGYSAALPPLVAAWAGNVLFFLLGLWLLLAGRE